MPEEKSKDSADKSAARNKKDVPREQKSVSDAHGMLLPEGKGKTAHPAVEKNNTISPSKEQKSNLGAHGKTLPDEKVKATHNADKSTTSNNGAPPGPDRKG